VSKFHFRALWVAPNGYYLVFLEAIGGLDFPHLRCTT